MDAVVTAGGRLKGALAEATGQEIKALVSLGGRTLLERSVSALVGSGSVGRVAVVGPPEVRQVAEAAGAEVYVPEEGSGIDNLMAGIRALDANGQIVMSVSDLVAVQPEDIDDLVARVPRTAGVSYVIVTDEEFLAAFPERRGKHFVELRDGSFTGGCVFVVDVAALKRIEPTLQLMFRARKLPVLLGSFVGWPLFFWLVLSRVLGRQVAPSTEEFKARVERGLGCEAAIVRGASPRIALDVDTIRDWRYAKLYVAKHEMSNEPHGGGARA